MNILINKFFNRKTTNLFDLINTFFDLAERLIICVAAATIIGMDAASFMGHSSILVTISVIMGLVFWIRHPNDMIV